MKAKILLLVLVIAGMASCTQKTCPTYAKVSKPALETKARI